MRILVVEDEKNLNRILSKHLKQRGYTVDACENGLDACDYMEQADYDAVVLDIMLPGRTGMEVLSWARGRGMETPILMLTAKDAVEDKVAGLDAGADDYLTKPFAFEELMARIRMLTRKKVGQHTNVFRCGDLEVDSGAKQVHRGKRKIPLSAREFAMLEYLIANQGIVLSREQLQEHLWGYDYEGSSNMVDVYIRYLRKKVDEGFSSRLIHTVRGSGYVLREES